VVDGGRRIFDDIYMFLERVVESAYTHAELQIVAQWVADYCRQDSDALEYFKELCLSQHEYIIEINKNTTTLDQFRKAMTATPKEKAEA
jgi:hypothetical protein